MTNVSDAPTSRTRWTEIADQLGAVFAGRADDCDSQDKFVAENFADLKKAGLMSAMVPEEFGGGGASYEDVCDLLRVLGRHCGSTALAFSMHQHLLAGVLWRWRNQKAPVEALLRKIAAEQTVLISSGGSDWLDGSGVAQKVEGGYKIKARKVFASGSPAGDLLMTMAVTDGDGGPTVLHFPISFKTPGVKVLDTWRVMGMRATGSHDLEIDDVFVPDAAVAVRRPQGKWHPSMHVVALVAIPLIYSAYLGVAEAARDIAVRECGKRKGKGDALILIGEMENELAAARLAWRSMVNRAVTGAPGEEATNATMIERTLTARGALAAVEKAMEAVGGRSFYRSLGLERRFRDIQGARFHPLTPAAQARLAGRRAVGLPIDG